ncbi:hypothetical protein HMPREF9123_2606 [Neisseria bacilliformis ATCC BAA-1200]|uniref:Uncharacterized protein n=1 Tax=Neisseria bacilliformis ATCC BAA-1200 TaxID=888742 RepID=F2BFU9_9NEIS|nr:hypothetical protein HMPREF9123_2606 [Neisseria bacilliformis ATCC BAA-1200]
MTPADARRKPQQGLDTLRGFATRQMPFYGAKTAVIPNANRP